MVETRLNHLLPSPGSGGREGHVEVPDRAPGIVEDQEDVDHAEGDSRHGEEVDRDDVPGVVSQEGAPGLRRRAIGLEHVLGDGGLADVDAELEQLAVDTRSAP